MSDELTGRNSRVIRLSHIRNAEDRHTDDTYDTQAGQTQRKKEKKKERKKERKKKYTLNKPSNRH